MSLFKPVIAAAEIQERAHDDAALFELLLRPLHEALYDFGSFAFLDELPDLLQLLLCHDYVRNQVLPGGFIQLFHNGYVGLLPEMPRQWTALDIVEMAQVIDLSLQLYVQHHVAIIAEMTPDAFAKLYQQFPEFQPVDDAFCNALPAAEAALLAALKANLSQLYTILP